MRALAVRMADILVATLPNVSVTDDEIEDARRCIDVAAFKRFEKLLELKSPDERLRRNILDAVSVFRKHPDPASKDRRAYKALRGHVCNVHQHLLELRNLLPAIGQHDEVQSSFLFAILDEATKSNGHFEGRDYVTFKEGLDTLEQIIEKLAVRLAKERVAPASKHGAAILLIRRLADIFFETTRNDPRQHIHSNRDKDTYRGKFFQMVDDILRRVGHKQSNAARGRMISKTLQKHYGPRKKTMPRRI
jgi:hypothetical protein